MSTIVAHSGIETLADLQTKHGLACLDTVRCSITGSGGLHLLFQLAPPGVVGPQRCRRGRHRRAR